MVKGIYGLLVEAHGATLVGRLGAHRFDGVYAYVGSAQGAGGLARRIARHRAVASGARATRHWHVDSLLGLSERIDVVAAACEDPDAECALADELARRAQGAVDGFGASDCACRSHLFRLSSWETAPLAEALRALGLRPWSV